MKLSILIAIIFFPSLLGFHSSQEEQKQILAIIGNHNITLPDFESRYYNYLISSGVNDNIVVRRSILDNMINEILLYNYDLNEKIFSDSDYLNELDESHIRVILAYLKDQEIYAKITVTEKEIREAFSKVNEKIAARHLYAATEEEADRLYELLKIGVTFESLASQVFTDSVLKNNGGYLGYFTWGDMDPSFEEAAYNLKIGEISSPVKTAQGYSIIKLEDRISNPLLTEYEFQNKKSHLEKVLKIRKKIPSEKEYINKIFDRNKLSFNEKCLENILDELYKKNQVESDKKTFSQECVVYDGKIYNHAEIAQKLSDLPDYHKERINSTVTFKAAIEGLLIKDILYSIAVNEGYNSSEPVLSMIEGYKKNIFLKYKFDEITENSYIPDSVIFGYYKNNINLYSNERELNLQEILVDSENLADSLMKLISDGYDFGELAREFSLRNWSSDNEGILGFASLSKFGSYKDLFWNTEIGELIGPLKIENLYGIFRVLGKTDAEPIDFGLIKKEVTKAAQFESQTEIVKKYIDSLRKKVKLKINYELLGLLDFAG